MAPAFSSTVRIKIILHIQGFYNPRGHKFSLIFSTIQWDTSLSRQWRDFFYSWARVYRRLYFILKNHPVLNFLRQAGASEDDRRDRDQQTGREEGKLDRLANRVGLVSRALKLRTDNDTENRQRRDQKHFPSIRFGEANR